MTRPSQEFETRGTAQSLIATLWKPLEAFWLRGPQPGVFGVCLDGRLGGLPRPTTESAVRLGRPSLSTTPTNTEQCAYAHNMHS
jgi:hypothetical protein